MGGVADMQMILEDGYRVINYKCYEETRTRERRDEDVYYE